MQANHALIQVEQLRLLLGNVGSSVIPAYLLAVLMAVGLGHVGGQETLWLWCMGVIASKTVCYWHARVALRSRMEPDERYNLYAEVMLLNIIDAVAWALLSWITLSSANMVEFMLVNSVLAGIAGSSMSLLSPVWPVFVSFIGVEFLMVAYKFWQLGDPSYSILSLALVLYFSSLSMQARNSAQAALSAIKLRFENMELLARLREETQKAVEAHQEAVQANLAKSKFLAAASHDLRQPIHALGLFLAVLEGTRLNEEQAQVLGNAQSVNEASSEMLGTLLDFSRIEAGVVEVQTSAFRLQNLLNKLENEFAPQAEAKGLLYRSRDSDAVLLSDPGLVELILRNLIANAIRYSDRGGVLVGCRVRGGWASIEVWDTGIGIPPGQLQAIFREFHQLGNAERDRRKGLGLGLAIAEGLARSLGLHITVDSRPGRGSVFRFRVPLAAQAADVPNDDVTAWHAPAPRQLRLLVLEDDESVRQGMCQLLRQFGWQCEAVETVEEAMAAIERQRPDLLISDYRLRGTMTGVDAIAAVRARLDGHCPALLITGDTDPERLRDAHASKVQLLHKPVVPEVLYRAILHEMDSASQAKADAVEKSVDSVRSAP